MTVAIVWVDCDRKHTARREGLMHQMFINGTWSRGTDARYFDVDNPATGEVIASVPDASAVDLDHAVSSAQNAFGTWSSTEPNLRADLLSAFADRLEDNADEVAATVTAELGAPVKLAHRLHTQLAIQDIQATVEALRTSEFERVMGNSTVRSVPIGVVGAITPWNYPVHQVVSKIVPAIAAGATVVLKPSELAPLSALLLAKLSKEAGLPSGVLNVLTGSGAGIGQQLVRHPGVDAISFTGSEGVGAAVAAGAAPTFKKVTLELGGKSASLVLDDADLDAAVKVTVANCFLNSGQSCNALTRLLVPEHLLDYVEQVAVEAARKHLPGDPTLSSTRMGPVISEVHRQRIWEHVRSAQTEGARLIYGGSERPAELPEKGHYVTPTIFSNVDPHSTIAQEEVFGPVLSILTYDTVDSAVSIANGTRFGLGGAVWSGDTDRAKDIASRIRTGQIDINGAAFNPAAPFGGFRNSGYGRELGAYGIGEFLTTQSIQL